MHRPFLFGGPAFRPRRDQGASDSACGIPSSSPNLAYSRSDFVGRDAARLKALWAQLDANGSFDLAGPDFAQRVEATGFVSGSSTHANRISTIRGMHEDYGMIVDTHTADGIKVGLEHREAGIALICLETAQPAKFAETIHEALGQEPGRPAGYENLEGLPQRFEVIEADAAQVKAYIAAHA